MTQDTITEDQRTFFNDRMMDSKNVTVLQLKFSSQEIPNLDYVQVFIDDVPKGTIAIK